MMKNKKLNSGITLVALVVTIIVLLILVTVSLNMVFDNNGIISRAKEAAEKTRQAAINEMNEMNDLETQISNFDNLEIQSIGDSLGSCGIQGSFDNPDVVQNVVDTTPGTFAGSGTEADPYLIESIEDLGALSFNVAYGESYAGKTFKLVQSLDFDSDLSYCNPNDTYIFSDYFSTGGSIKENFTEGQGFVSIGRSDVYPFKGDFDGNMKTIKGLYMNETFVEDMSFDVYDGFFGILNGNVKNLSLIGNVYVSVNYDYGEHSYLSLGGLVGSLSNGNVSNCKFSGEVKVLGSGYISNIGVSGIVASNLDSTITNCVSDAKIQNGNVHCEYLKRANIVSHNESSTISNCIGKGEFLDINLTNVNDYLAGVVAENEYNSNIENCINHSNFILKNTYSRLDNQVESIGGIASKNCGVLKNSINSGNFEINMTNPRNEIEIEIGGVAAYSDESIEKCVNKGRIIANCMGTIGGIAGTCDYGEIKNSYNEGLVKGSGIAIGGVVGYINNETLIEKCFNNGEITGMSSESYLGGILGMTSDTGINSIVRNSYNSGKISGVSNSAGGIIGNYDLNKNIVKNVYQSGEINITAVNKGGLLGMSNSNLQVTNGYYLNTTASSGYGNFSNITGAKSEEEMKSDAFVTLLNSDGNVFEKVNNNYPKLSGM